MTGRRPPHLTDKEADRECDPRQVAKRTAQQRYYYRNCDKIREYQREYRERKKRGAK